MLNELATLRSSLKQFNVHVQELHPWVTRLGYSDALILGLDSSGRVGAVEFLDKRRAVQLPKIKQSNHSNFPSLNWDAPIWRGANRLEQIREFRECPRDDVRARLALLKKICTKAELSDSQEDVWEGVKKLAQSYRRRFEKIVVDDEFKAFHVLLDRTATSKVSAREFFESLTDAAFVSCANGSVEATDLVESLLVGMHENGKERMLGKVPILMDLTDCTRFACRVADPRMAFYFSKCLQETETTLERKGTCALTGELMPLEFEKMPSARLPVLGDTIIMSMNPDTPCLKRYGRTGPPVFQVGKTTAAGLNSALLHLTSADREGKNWGRFPGRSKGKLHLLLVYFQSAPMLDASLAALFSQGHGAEELYSATCEDVCRALEGHGTSGSSLLQLFLLNKVSKGQVQIELTLSVTATQVIEGGREWELAIRNVPSCVALDKPRVPYPGDVVRCLKSVWIRRASDSVELPGIEVNDIYNLLIAGMPGAELSGRLILRTALSRASTLLGTVGHAAHREAADKKAWTKISPRARSSYAVAVAVLGLVLYKLGHRKDLYMAEPAFLLGRLLSLVDTLHREYCKEVRGGDIPPQLLGNSLMSTITNDPRRGLARMRERIRVYQGWAATRGSALARWSLGEMGRISTDLAQSLPERMNDAAHAQFLLGYLARFEKTENEPVGEGATQ